MRQETKRTTVYLEPALHKALRLKAAETDYSISEIINEAIKQSLLEDFEDLDAFERTRKEPDLVFEDVLKDLKRRGRL